MEDRLLVARGQERKEGLNTRISTWETDGTIMYLNCGGGYEYMHLSKLTELLTQQYEF